MQTIETFYIHTIPGETSIAGAKEDYQCLVCMKHGETKKDIVHSSNCPLIAVGKIINGVMHNNSIRFVIDSWSCSYCGMSGYTVDFAHLESCPTILAKQFEEFF